jgi:hypothetical protein
MPATHDLCDGVPCQRCGDYAQGRADALEELEDNGKRTRGWKGLRLTEQSVEDYEETHCADLDRVRMIADKLLPSLNERLAGPPRDGSYGVLLDRADREWEGITFEACTGIPVVSLNGCCLDSEGPVNADGMCLVCFATSLSLEQLSITSAEVATGPIHNPNQAQLFPNGREH